MDHPLTPRERKLLDQAQRPTGPGLQLALWLGGALCLVGLILIAGPSIRELLSDSETQRSEATRNIGFCLVLLGCFSVLAAFLRFRRRVFELIRKISAVPPGQAR